MRHLKTDALLDLSRTIAADYLGRFDYPWLSLADLRAFILALGNALPKEGFDSPREQVWIAKSAKVAPSAFFDGPLIIDEGAEIRHCAFLRGSAIIGKGAVVGNSTEVKNAVLFDGAQAPHFNYVGDSILGYRAHMGAGSVTSNLKSDKTPVTVLLNGEKIATGLKKFGAVLGDYAEIGCNSVLNPGTVIGRNATVYPTASVRGFVRENSIYKDKDTIITKHIKGE